MRLATNIAANLLRHQMGTWVVEAMHNFDMERQIKTGYSRSGIYYARKQFGVVIGVPPKDLLIADHDADLLIAVIESRRASRHDVPVNKQKPMFGKVKTAVTVGGQVEWLD